MKGDATGMDLSGLSVQGLYDIVVAAHPPSPIWDAIPTHKTIDEVGEEISEKFSPAYEIGPSPLEYWERFKGESHLLLCTNNQKYAPLRKELSQYGGKTQLTIVSTIAASVAASVGVVAGAMVPLCAICLIAVLKMGKLIH